MVKVVERCNLLGKVPQHVLSLLTEAIEQVPQRVFFRGSQPLKTEITKMDKETFNYLNRKCPKKIEKNHEPIQGSRFSIDLFLEQYGTLVEIEKGQLPRLEFDIIKILSACVQDPEKYEYGVIIVPRTYIELKLQGKDKPYQYLTKRLSRLVQPILNEIGTVKGLAIIGYEDPREKS